MAAQLPGVNLQPIIDRVTTNAEIFPNQALPESVCEDPDGDKFNATLSFLIPIRTLLFLLVMIFHLTVAF